MFLYFGCRREPGHYFWDDYRRVWDNPSPWPQVDAALCPGYRAHSPSIEQPGALLHQKDGWTAIAFWDRTVDSRPGSNSVFLTDQILGFDEMVRQAKEKFPDVIGRLGFEIVRFGVEKQAQPVR